MIRLLSLCSFFLLSILSATTAFSQKSTAIRHQFLLLKPEMVCRDSICAEGADKGVLEMYATLDKISFTKNEVLSTVKIWEKTKNKSIPDCSGYLCSWDGTTATITKTLAISESGNSLSFTLPKGKSNTSYYFIFKATGHASQLYELKILQ